MGTTSVRVFGKTSQRVSTQAYYYEVYARQCSQYSMCNRTQYYIENINNCRNIYLWKYELEIIKIISLCGKTGNFLFSKPLMYHCIISTFFKKTNVERK